MVGVFLTEEEAKAEAEEVSGLLQYKGVVQQQ